MPLFDSWAWTFTMRFQVHAARWMWKAIFLEITTMSRPWSSVQSPSKDYDWCYKTLQLSILNACTRIANTIVPSIQNWPWNLSIAVQINCARWLLDRDICQFTIVNIPLHLFGKSPNMIIYIYKPRFHYVGLAMWILFCHYTVMDPKHDYLV